MKLLGTNPGTKYMLDIHSTTELLSSSYGSPNRSKKHCSFLIVRTQVPQGSEWHARTRNSKEPATMVSQTVPQVIGILLSLTVPHQTGYFETDDLDIKHPLRDTNNKCLYCPQKHSLRKAIFGLCFLAANFTVLALGESVHWEHGF